MANPSITYSWDRDYSWPYLTVPGTGVASGFQFNNAAALSTATTGCSVTGGSTVTLSAYIDATAVSSGAPYFGAFDSEGHVVISKTATAGTAGSVSTSGTMAASTTVLYPFFDTSNCTINAGDFLVFSEPQVIQGASTSAPFTTASVNLVPDPLFNGWYLGNWGNPNPMWSALAGPLTTSSQPTIIPTVTPTAGQTISSWELLIYVAGAALAPGFTPGQAGGLVYTTSGTGNPPASVTLSSNLANGQYTPLMKVTQPNGATSGWVPPNSYDSMLAGMSPTAWWKLDDAKGSATAVDASGNGNAGSVSAGVTLGVAGPVLGNTAASFNGTSASIGIPLVTSASTNVSIVTWFEMPSGPIHGAIVKIGSDTTGYGIGVGGGTTQQATYLDNPGKELAVLFEDERWVPSGAYVTPGWHMTALVIDASGYPWIYLDGNLVYTDTNSPKPNAPASVAAIGADPGISTRFWPSSIAEVAVFDTALTGPQISGLYYAKPWFNVLSGTPRMSLNVWEPDVGIFDQFDRPQVNSDATTIDTLATLATSGPATNLSGATPEWGTEYVATDTAIPYTGTAPAGTAKSEWQPMLTKVDTDVLSTSLPAPGHAGTWYHATDTDQIWRDSGTQLTQILTAPTIANYSGLAPSGMIMLYPAVWSGTSTNWTLTESAVPSGWLYCLGQPLSTTTYADLFSVIGYAWTWKNTATGSLVSGSGLTGDQGTTADYIIFGATSGSSSPSSTTTANYAQVTSGTTFCIPNFSPAPSALGVPYSANTTKGTTTAPLTVPIIKL